jgi:ribosome-associated protein
MPGENLFVRPGLVIPAADLTERFSSSGGPGGQHANRANSRVELVVDLAGSTAFDDRQRRVLLDRFGDEQRVVVDDERSQLRNRELARARAAARLANALAPRRPRRPTRPTRASARRRLEAKRQRADTKRHRRRPSAED